MPSPGFRPAVIVCIVASFTASAAEPRSPKAKAAALELQLLQGTWEGAVAGDMSFKKITITITGNSLHFHRDPNFWFETTITLPAGTDPKQLLATIKGCPPSQASSIGQVVGAIFKVEGGTLTLATGGDGPGETPESFDATSGLTRYELRKVQPQMNGLLSAPGNIPFEPPFEEAQAAGLAHPEPANRLRLFGIAWGRDDPFLAEARRSARP